MNISRLSGPDRLRVVRDPLGRDADGDRAAPRREPEGDGAGDEDAVEKGDEQ